MSAMVWACMTAEVLAHLSTLMILPDGRSKLNSEVYTHIISAQVQVNASKLIGQKLILQQDNDAKHQHNFQS